MKLSKELAKLYYTAAEARKELGLDDEAFQYWVRKGRIKKITLPGRVQGVYSKKEVNTIRDEITATMIAEHESVIFKRATVDDIEKEAKLAHLVFGEKAEAIEERTAFLSKNPDIDYHLYDEGQLVAYINIIPLKHEAIEEFMDAKIKAWDIRAEDIEDFSTGKQLECLIIDMITTPTVPPLKRTIYGSKLLLGLIKVLAEMGKRGVEISKIYAASETPTGIRIITNAGFKVTKEARKGRFSFELDIMNSDEKVLKEYKAAIEEWKQSRSKQTTRRKPKEGTTTSMI